MITDILAAVLVTALFLFSSYRHRTSFNPALLVTLEFWGVILVVYTLWDYTGWDFGKSFYVWLAVKDTFVALLLIVLFKRWSIALLACCYAVAAIVNARFFMSELHYMNLSNTGKREYYDVYLTIWHSYPSLIYTTVAGQIVGLITHENSGNIRRFFNAGSRWLTGIHKPGNSSYKTASGVARVEKP